MNNQNKTVNILLIIISAILITIGAGLLISLAILSFALHMGKEIRWPVEIVTPVFLLAGFISLILGTILLFISIKYVLFPKDDKQITEQ